MQKVAAEVVKDLPPQELIFGGSSSLRIVREKLHFPVRNRR